jgi:hypothetical protein
MRLFQNPVGANLRFDETTSWKSGQIGRKSGPLFPLKSKVAVPKTEVLEQPRMSMRFYQVLAAFPREKGRL